MSFLDHLSFGLRRKLPQILQTEATECGLACIAMVAGYHGLRTDLATLRRLFLVSIKGSTLGHLMQMAHSLNLSTRPVKLDLEDLPQLRMPCILHWDFNHFVVLKEVDRQTATIHDPAFGIRKLPLSEVSEHFTGVALELWPNTGFKPVVLKQRVRLRQLMGHVTGLYRSLGQVLLLAVSLEVFALVSPFFLQWVIDNVIVSGDRDLLTTLAIGFGLLMLMQQGIGALRSWVIMHLATTLNVQWRANVFSHLLRLPVEYFEKRHLGDVVSRFGSIDVIQKTLTTSFVEGILDGMMTIVVLIVMFIYSPLLAWIAVAAMALYGIVRWLWYRPLRNATEEQIIHAAKQQSHFLETVRGVRSIKLFQRQEERRATWLSLLVDQINADLRNQKLQIFYRLANGLLFGVERILIIWLGAKLILDGHFTVGALMAFSAYKDQFDSRVSALIDRIVEIKMLQLQGERLADIVFATPENESQSTLTTTQAAPADASIELCELGYRYADNEPWVLDGINLRIQPGESIAIIGPSGCGKSTLISTMLGIRQPSRGEVRIGGQAVDQVGIGVLRSMVGTVLQDDVLFAGSIADNISFFDHHPEPARIEECARLAAIHDDIMTMPMGYNTLIGDMGAALSGGQKQRILLARALYKRPQILFLDEATSHLDISCEKRVNAAIRGLNITRVIVAHRPETIASADRVLVLEQGRIVRDLPAAELDLAGIAQGGQW